VFVASTFSFFVAFWLFETFTPLVMKKMSPGFEQLKQAEKMEYYSR